MHIYKRLKPGDKILVGDEWYNGEIWHETTSDDCFVGAIYKDTYREMRRNLPQIREAINES